MRGFELPAGKVLDPGLVVKLAKDVLPGGELRRTVDQLDGRASACELECIEGRAVTATDDRRVTPGEAEQLRLELVRDVAAECPVGGGVEVLLPRTGGDDQGPAGHSPAVDFDRTSSQICLGRWMRQPHPVAEDLA